MKPLYFLLLLVSLTLVVDVDAGWKFWKKKKDNSTEDPLASSTTSAPSTTARSAVTTSGRGQTRPSANRGIAAAADPALAVGVGSSGGRIREDSRGQSRKPNPGTEVGLDISQPKPARPGTGGANGQSYRDFAADLTGAGDPGKAAPKLPDHGPALTPGGGSLHGRGNRPTSLPGTSSGQQPAVASGGRPASVAGTATGNQAPAAGSAVGAATAKAAATPTSTQAPTPTAQPSTPAPRTRPPLSIPRPGSPGSPPRTWADIAGGGRPGSPAGGPKTASSTPAPKNASPTPAPKAGSPTPAPKPGSPIPSRSGIQQPFDHSKSSNPGQTRPGAAGTAAAAGGALIGAGAAAAGAAAIAGNSGKMFTSNPTFSKGNTVTDEDLEKLSEALFLKDVNNANKYITLNLQKQTSGSGKDEAPQPLFDVKPEALQIPTIQKVVAIYDNYKLDTRENEYISPTQRQEESLLVDTFLSTNVMSMAMRFLSDKGFIKKDYYDYKDTLRSMWFNLYSRGDGKIGSTGFEHVFLTELKLGNEVLGLHNWIYFNAEEIKKRLDYLGYIKKLDLGTKGAVVKAHITFNGIDKPVTAFLVGTSPELEMALYTVCFFARPDGQCPISLGGTKFNIVTHKFRYRGRDLIGSAYPDI